MAKVEEELKTLSPQQIQKLFNLTPYSLRILREQGMHCIVIGKGTKKPRYRYFVSKVKEFLEKERNEENCK